MRAHDDPTYEDSILRTRRDFPIELVRVLEESAAARRLLDEILALSRDERLLRVLTDPSCATVSFVATTHEAVRDALRDGQAEALELAELSVYAARRCSGPPRAAETRLRHILESLCLLLEAELAFGSRSRADHYLYEAVAFSHGFDDEPLASIELLVAIALASFANHHREDTHGALREAQAVARSIKDQTLTAQVALVEVQMLELHGHTTRATAARLALDTLHPEPIPDSHWHTVLRIIHLRTAPVPTEVLQ